MLILKRYFPTVSPSILGSDMSKKVFENEEVLLECVSKGNPEPAILWLKEGQIIIEEQMKNLVTHLFS